jgi:hypothetical protein
VRFGRLWIPLPCVTARPRASSLEGVPSHDECDDTRRARPGTRTAVRYRTGGRGAALIQARDGSGALVHLDSACAYGQLTGGRYNAL